MLFADKIDEINAPTNTYSTATIYMELTQTDGRQARVQPGGDRTDRRAAADHSIGAEPEGGRVADLDVVRG